MHIKIDLLIGIIVLSALCAPAFGQALTNEADPEESAADDPLAWYTKGTDLAEQDDYEGALEAFEELIKFSSPQSFEIALGYDAKGMSLYHLGNYEGAIEAFENAIASYPAQYSTENVQFWKGNCHFILEEYADAVQAYEEAIEQSDDMGMAWYYKSRALEQLGSTEEAEAALAKADELTEQTSGEKAEDLYRWIVPELDVFEANEDEGSEVNGE